MMLRLIVVLLTFSFPASAFAQGQIPRDFQRYVEDTMEFVGDSVRPHLSRHEREIQRDVRVRVPRDWSFTAQATNGRITISAGTAWLLQQLAMANVAEQFAGFRGCALDYIGYMQINVHENSVRASNNRPVRPVFSPGLYGQQFGGPCRGFNDNSFADPRFNQAYRAQMNASLTFLYLHELAHHTEEHLDQRRLTPAMSQAQEAEADAWAIRIMVESGIAAPAAALPMMQFLAMFGGVSLEDEIKSSHPLGSRRARDTMRYAAELHEDRGEYELAEETRDLMRAAADLMP